MRRPIFNRWIRRECMRLAGVQQFSLVKLAALAQSPRAGSSDRVVRRKLAAALHLYALSNGCEKRLIAHTYRQDVRKKQAQAAKSIGARDIQRLALRSIPMMSLPLEYREVLQAFNEAYHTPELVAAEKQELQRESRLLQLETGATPTEIARAIGIAPTNAIAYLGRAAVEKVTLETARDIKAYLQALSQAEASFVESEYPEVQSIP